jgi:hypothetical protein
MMKTAEQFKAATGRDPINDDLERANCNLAGSLGHHYCGWCEVHNKPRFLCHCGQYTYCVNVLEGHREQVLSYILRADQEASVCPEGNPTIFWVKTTVPMQEITSLEGVADAISSTVRW